MKIALFSLADLTASTADAVTSIRTAKYLAEAGHQVLLIAPQQASDQLTIDPGEVEVRFHFNMTLLGLPNTLNSLVQWCISWGLLNRSQQDLFYVRAATLTFLFGLRRRIGLGPPIFSEHHGWFETERKIGGRFTAIARFERILQVLDVRLADRVRTVVPGIRDLFVQHGANSDKVAVIGNACDTGVIVPLDRTQALAQRGLVEDRKYIGYLGSLTVWQGLDCVAEAMRHIAAARADVDLLVVGDGPLRDELNRLVTGSKLDDRVHFLGRCRQNEVSEILACFDVALLPTANTGYAQIGRSPLKLREYAAAGKTIVAAAIPSVSDYADEPWLSTYRLDDASHLAETAVELLDKPDQLEQSRPLARDYAQTHFSWPAVTQNVCAELAKLAE